MTACFRDKAPRLFSSQLGLIVRAFLVVISAKTGSCFVACIGLLATLAGCSSTSGLLLQPGPHKLLESAETFAHKMPHELNTPRESQKQFLTEYRVEPGDALAVEPVDFNSPIRLPSDQTVLPDGVIELGRYGRMTVAGMTMAEIEHQIQSKINEHHRQDEDLKDEQKQIAVRLTEPESKVYYVLGEVNSPGAFQLIGRETVLDAIIQAGGLGDRANRHRIILSRPTGPDCCRVVLPFCYLQVVQLADTTTNYQIRPGDRIFVPSLTFTRELKYFFLPTLAETCPKCAEFPVPCPDVDGCLTCGTASQERDISWSRQAASIRHSRGRSPDRQSVRR